MTTQLNPYLSFRDTARQAMEFYQSVFGGTLEISTFAEMPGIPQGGDPAEADKVMHSVLEGDHGITLMAADTPNSMDVPAASAISVSLSGDDEPLLRGWWDKLSDGAEVTAAFEKAPWGDTFGMCVDRFGVNWLVNVSGDQG
jgi:PhnB protein